MKISIVLATFNASNVLARCIESIASQTYQHAELIIIDGGSTDGSIEIIRSHSNNINYWESAPDRGIAHAWNKGIARATGDWLLFLGADDYLWGTNSLASMVKALESLEPGNKVVYGNVYAVDKRGVTGRLLSAPWNRAKYVYFGIYFSHQGVFHHKSLFAEFGDIDENFKYGPDYEFLLRYLVNHDAVYIPEVTVTAMQMGGISNCPENAAIALKDLARARHKHGIRRNSLLYYWAILKAYAKLGISKITKKHPFAGGNNS